MTRIRLGVLDRDRLMMDGLSAWLESFSTRIELVTVASKWADLFIGGDFPYDVVLFDVTMAEDISMPVKLESMAARGVKTLAMCSSPDPVVVEGAFAAGVNGFVAKTEGMLTVADAVRQVFDDGSFLSSEVSVVLAAHRTVGAPLPKLTKQEIRVLALYAQGRTMKNVAFDLTISTETARTYVKQLRQKLASAGFDVSDKVSLHQFAVNHGLLHV